MKKLLAVTLILLTNTVFAADAEFTLVIREHRFEPTELTVPAGEKIKLKVENKDGIPEEFESHELNREKIVLGNSSTTIYIGPLAPGRYLFFGEFNEKTAQGVLIAK